MLNDLTRYIGQSAPQSPAFWMFPMGAMLVFYIVAMILTKIRPLPHPFSRMLNALSNIALAGSLVAAGVAGIALYYWSADLYRDEHLEFSHLLSLCLVLLTTFFVVMIIANMQGKAGLRDVVVQPYTQMEKSITIQKARNWYSANRLLVVALPLLGSIFLLPMFRVEKRQLLCIVLDNSSSMGTPTPSGIIPLEVGKEALGRTLQDLNENTTVILTHFDDRGAKKNLVELLSVKTTGALGGVSVPYEEDKSEAVSYVEQLGLRNVSPGSPLCEAVWKTYLMAQELNSTGNFTNKYMVIITDGEENGVEGDLSGFLCDQPEFNELFDANSIKIIQLESALPPPQNFFLEKATGCGYEILNGTTTPSYNAAIDQIVGETQNDQWFPLWILLLYIIFAIAMFALNPKQPL